jgi:hypothetical protein
MSVFEPPGGGDSAVAGGVWTQLTFPTTAGDPRESRRVLASSGDAARRSAAAAAAVAAAAAEAADMDGLTPDDAAIIGESYLMRSKPLRCAPSEVGLSAARSAALDVRIAGVRFHDHELFCKEDWLASGLVSLFETYTRRLKVRVCARAT